MMSHYRVRSLWLVTLLCNPMQTVKPISKVAMLSDGKGARLSYALSLVCPTYPTWGYGGWGKHGVFVVEAWPHGWGKVGVFTSTVRWGSTFTGVWKVPRANFCTVAMASHMGVSWGEPDLHEKLFLWLCNTNARNMRVATFQRPRACMHILQSTANDV